MTGRRITAAGAGRALASVVAATLAAVVTLSPVPHATAVTIDGRVAVTPGTAATSVIVACVNRRTGAMRLRLHKRCRAGWRTVRWNEPGPAGPSGVAGPDGPAGPAGAAGGTVVVRDGAGNPVTGVIRVGRTELAGLAVVRLVDGGLFTFLPDGTVFAWDPEMALFRSHNCTGTVYLDESLDPPAAGTQQRLVLQSATGGPATAYSFTNTTVAYALGDAVTYWSELPGGSYECLLRPYDPDLRMRALSSVGAPPAALPGPLTIT